MSEQNSKLNALVLIGLCVVAYLAFSRHGHPAPPDDPWFKQNIGCRSVPVLVKFGADWCGPCRMLEPELDRLESDPGFRVAVVRVNVDQQRKLASHYGVSSIPRILLFRDGQVIADRTGYADQQQLRHWVASSR